MNCYIVNICKNSGSPRAAAPVIPLIVLLSVVGEIGEE